MIPSPPEPEKKDLNYALRVFKLLSGSTKASILKWNGVDCNHSVVVQPGKIKGYQITVVSDRPFARREFEPWSLELDIDGYLVNTDHAYEIEHSVYLSQLKHEQLYSISISEFRSRGLTAEPSFWRVVIPLPNKAFGQRHFQIEQEVYSFGTSTNLGRVPVRLNNVAIDVLFHKDERQEFLIFDVLDGMQLTEAQEYVHDIGLALGYVTGEFVQNECYCFGYPSEEMVGEAKCFSYHELRESIVTAYHPICSNPYSYLHSHRADADRLFPLLRTLSFLEFSKLCQRVLADDQFAAQLLLILESMAASVVTMPPGLCVALEGIAKTPSAEKAPVAIDVTVKAYIEGLLPNVLKQLKALENSTNEGLIAAMSGRLKNLTHPSNRAQLEAPFSAVNYTLCREDVQAINSRNRFLHGDVLLGNKNGVMQASMDAYYMALRLYALLAVLILKPTGYDNYIINYAKLNERVHGKNLDEDYYLPLNQGH